MAAFAQDACRQFEQRVKEHLGEFWGERCARMGEEEVMRSIREAVKRAEAHGLESELDIARYIDLCYMLSPDFEDDPRTPWVAEILSSDRPPAGKMREIYRRLERDGYI